MTTASAKPQSPGGHTREDLEGYITDRSARDPEFKLAFEQEAALLARVRARQTPTHVSEFPAKEHVELILAKLDEHRQRQVLAFLAERYGLSLQPTQQRIQHQAVTGNASEFAAIEEAAEILDDLSAPQRELAIEGLAKEFKCKIQPAYKPAPVRGRAPGRKFYKG